MRLSARKDLTALERFTTRTIHLARYITMSTIQPPLITISSLRFIKPADLANSLRQPETASKVAVIDVRDNDHLGGHVRGSQWVPINHLDARIPELLRVNKDKDRVVFHCMLSQQRGPKAALTYARAKAYEVEKQKVVKHQETDTDESKEIEQGSGKIGGQEVCVLEGGFDNWRRFYAEDAKLTDGYIKDLWD